MARPKKKKIIEADSGEMAEVFSVGHEPQPGLHPEDEKFVRAFQANLLSLISHELRTPLTGVLNALNLLDDDSRTEFSLEELISMARRNAKRLHHTLAMLLDLAALDSGTFHPRLKEVSLENLVRARCQAALLESGEKQFHLKIEQKKKNLDPVLLDPQKFGRALELCFHLLLPVAEKNSTIEVLVSDKSVRLSFQVQPEHEEELENAWIQTLAGSEGGLGAVAAFREALQLEENFLTRSKEGLGSELSLIHQIMKMHQGVATKTIKNHVVTLTLELPERSSMDALLAVVSSRAYLSSTGVGTVALGLVQIPSGETMEQFRSRMRSCLFRATDSIYSLPEQNQLALVMDDCKLEDVPRIVGRIERAMGKRLQMGLVSCPEEATDPEMLIELAQKRLSVDDQSVRAERLESKPNQST